MQLPAVFETICHKVYPPKDESQATVICRGNWLTIGFMFFYGIVSCYIQFRQGIYIQLILIVLFFSAFIWYRNKFPLDFIGNYISAIGFAGVISLCYFSGGLYSPVLPWISLVPIVSLLFSRASYAISWLLLVIASILIYHLVLSNAIDLPVGYDLKYHDLFYLFSLLGLISTYFLLSLIYQHSLSKSKQNLIVKNMEIESKNNILQEQTILINNQFIEIEKERIKSDDLLRNVLPQEIANDLKSNGRSDAKLYKNVSILFTDFVGFSKYCQTISPEDLIDTLHEYFIGFDKIIEKNCLEKIKTIGDSYMAVSGLPNASENHAYNAVNAGIEILQFVKDIQSNQKTKSSTHIHPMEIRIGIHSGSVIAGIIGNKRFAFDIWGDDVNTAARIEQIGPQQQVSLSEQTYNLVKDKMSCTYQGQFPAKNKGMLNLYTINSINSIPSLN
ncbi:MAG: adenylate/guanylate cyclase domain-containing protein [Saprospiraceae bacterium]